MEIFCPTGSDFNILQQKMSYLEMNHQLRKLLEFLCTQTFDWLDIFYLPNNKVLYKYFLKIPASFSWYKWNKHIYINGIMSVFFVCNKYPRYLFDRGTLREENWIDLEKLNRGNKMDITWTFFFSVPHTYLQRLVADHFQDTHHSLRHGIV